MASKKSKKKKYAFANINSGNQAGGFLDGETLDITSPACFTDEELDSFITIVENDSIEAKIKASTSASGQGASYDGIRRSRVHWLAGDEYKWIYDRLWEVAKKVNQKYQFDINFIETMQVALYDSSEEGFFDWHMDMSAQNMIRKISITMPLNDESEYEGGQLEFNDGGVIRQAPQKKGNVIIFPSFLMHRVTPVTKGKRYSIVGWINGPKYR